jgi:hypothetical protein
MGFLNKGTEYIKLTDEEVQIKIFHNINKKYI